MGYHHQRKCRPPLTKRFCRICNKVTKFKYNPGVLHSACCECGSRFALNPERRFQEMISQSTQQTNIAYLCVSLNSDKKVGYKDCEYKWW